MINLLYKAAKAGVQVELIVRSVCCIVPAIDGMNNYITVRRIVDRFLEHSRLFIFGTDDDRHVFMGSADFMTRNLYHRIEVCFPVRDANCRQELVDYFEMQWADNSKAVQLLPNNQYKLLAGQNSNIINAQQSIYQYLKSKK